MTAPLATRVVVDVQGSDKRVPPAKSNKWKRTCNEEPSSTSSVNLNARVVPLHVASLGRSPLDDGCEGGSIPFDLSQPLSNGWSGLMSWIVDIR